MVPTYYFIHRIMTKEELKGLVKEYFSLVDAPSTEAKETFGQVSTADGSVTLHFPGDSIEIGTPLTIIDAEGNTIPAPAGEHLLADGQRVVLDETGHVTEFLTEEQPEEAEAAEEMAEHEGEEMPEEEAMGDYEDEETMEEEVTEEVIEEIAMEEAEEIIEEVIEEALQEEATEEEAPALDVKAIVEAVTESVMEEMKKEIAAMKAEMTAVEEKVETFAKAPAATKTVPTRRSEEIKSKTEMNVFNKARWERVLNQVKK